MAKCGRCQLRKGKRSCPALGMTICPLCCGLIREKRIHCPSTCGHLAPHKNYQEQRIIQRKQAYAEDVFTDERLSWLALHIEAALEERATRDPSFTDREALLALEVAREKVAKGKSHLVLPPEKTSFENETGEAIFKNIEACRYQRNIILPSEVAHYKKEEKLQCLDNIILEIKHLAAGDWAGRNYLQELHRRFTRLREMKEKEKVILPSS